MRIRLSTILLALITMSLAMGWWIDRSHYATKDIVGVWYSPTHDLPVPVVLHSTLEIRQDGTFTKSQKHRTHVDIYDGTYSISHGMVIFHVKSKTTKIGGGHKFTSTDKKKTDKQFAIRCAIDPGGYLVVDNRSQLHDEELGIRWHSHAR